MPCTNPLTGFRREDGSLTFTYSPFHDREQQTVSCGQCNYCRKMRTLAWSTRLVHEAITTRPNAFLTLTYNEDTIPEGSTLVVRDLQLFFKRLRFAHPEQSLRYYAVGEYGSKTLRPHYHVLLYGEDFNTTKEFFKSSLKGGKPLFKSEKLESLWGLGFCSFGAVTPESAAYCSGYLQKRITGTRAIQHYERTDPVTGEVTNVIPEFSTMSRNPGLGRDYYDKFGELDFQTGFTVIGEHKVPIPKRYWEWLRAEDPATYEEFRHKQWLALPDFPQFDKDRLDAIEECLELKRLSWKGTI